MAASSSLSNLHIMSYYEDRLNDVSNFDKLLSMNINDDAYGLFSRSSKRKLPSVDIRRRTSSFLRYKLPRIKGAKKKRKVMAKSTDSLNSQTKTRPSRALRRKPLALAELHDMYYVESSVDDDQSARARNIAQKSIKWLDTHIWHMKRGFDTRKQWGFCLPTRRKHWGLRALRNAFNQHALVHDGSFIRALEIHSNSSNGIEDIRYLLQRFVVSYRIL
jgi:hypothetical protein